MSGDSREDIVHTREATTMRIQVVPVSLELSQASPHWTRPEGMALVQQGINGKNLKEQAVVAAAADCSHRRSENYSDR